MTGQIVAPPDAEVEAEQPTTSEALRDLQALPDMPKLPSAAELAALVEASAPAIAGGVPAGVDGGPTDAADVLDWLVPAIEVIRRKMAANAAGGFLVTAADMQRHTEVSRLVDEISRVLAERA